MSTPQPGSGRVRAYIQFLAAVLYFFLARALAHHWATGLAQEQWTTLLPWSSLLPMSSLEPLSSYLEQAILAFLLLAGYAVMGFWLNGQQHSIAEQGLPLRPEWLGEAGLGLATGWALAVVCVLPMAVSGGIAIVLVLQPSAWAWLAADATFFALAALVEEVAFRGYGFQRLTQTFGPLGAALGYAAFYAIVQALQPGSNHASIAVSVALSLLLSTAYLRTRALWVSWGINFGWKASRALLFGLAISGVSSHSPVVQGNPMGPFWLTGGGYGLDGSWIAFVVLVAALPVVYRLTRELDYKWNVPVIVPGGIPVDLDAAARRQHESAMGATEPAPGPLVQILPAVASPANPERLPYDNTTSPS